MPTHADGWEDEQASMTSRSLCLGNSHTALFEWSGLMIMKEWA